MRAAPFPGMYQFIASTIVGPIAFTSGAFIGLLLVHFAISIAFALSYAALAARRRALADHPLPWGVAFGFAVMIVMHVALRLIHASPPPSAIGLLLGIVAHVVFFGLPVAYFIAAADRRQILVPSM